MHTREMHAHDHAHKTHIHEIHVREICALSAGCDNYQGRVRRLSMGGCDDYPRGGATYNRTPKTPGCRCVALVVRQLYSSHHDFDHACPLKALVAECLL